MSVFSQSMATHLKRLSLPIALSMRARSLYRRFGQNAVSAWSFRGAGLLG